MTIIAPAANDTACPLHLRIQLIQDKVVRRQPGAGSEKQSQKELPLICSLCGAAITDNRQRISVNGQHEHAFFNPAGIAFEIRCFRKASGCLIQGKATGQFSWFPGYKWQYATCSTCLAHLGWFFNSGQDSFFGLMINKVL